MMRLPRFASLSVCLVFGAASWSPAAHAAAPDAEQRSEARERFDRGLTLFNQGDNLGALAEFQRAYQLTGNALVLYNIARVQAAAADPVAALDTLDKLIADPGDLSAARKAQLQTLRQEQVLRIGSLLVQSNVPNARVEIDGMDAGELDTQKPLRLAVGRHVIGLIAPQHHPLRKTVLVAGQEQKPLEFALEPLAGALGRVRFRIEPLDVAVELDGQELGKTPHLLEVSVSPGRHQLLIKRPGYRSVAREINVPEAGVLEVDEILAFDSQSQDHRGLLQVRASEEEAVVFVNGAVVNQALSGVSLPEGQHRLRVERAGFVTSERIIEVPRGSSATIDVTLAPTAAYRADYAASASARRGWALGIGIGGLVVAGASTGYVVWNGGQVSDAQRDFDAALGEAQQACIVDHSSDCDELTTAARIREDDLDSKKKRQTLLGWVGVGVGAAAVTTGVVLWLTGKDPARYEPKPESDVFGSLDVSPWFSPAGGGLQLSTSL
jgi:tetratricopeptide (TPR) repeat protein